MYAFGDFLTETKSRFGDRVKGTPPMEKKSTPEEVTSMSAYDGLESWARLRVQEYIQDLLEEEVTVFLGRRKSGSCERGNGSWTSEWIRQAEAVRDDERDRASPAAASAQQRGTLRKQDPAFVSSEIKTVGTDAAGAVFAWLGKG